MPLIFEKSAGKSGKWGIWNISETLSELIQTAGFEEKEFWELKRFSNEQRKKQILCARILTAHLLKKNKMKIFYDENSKPVLKNEKYFVSLSHSGELLAAIIDRLETGIDIERIQTKIERIREKFMSAEELRAVGEKYRIEKLYVHWCVKESLYKWYGKKQLDFRKNFFVEPFDFSDSGKIKGWLRNNGVEKCLSLWYETIRQGHNDFMLAFIMND